MLFFLVAWLHVFLAPYTKVEESFNLHATHDLLFYGPLSSSLSNVRLPKLFGPMLYIHISIIACFTQYDHFVFPGVVPRSFLPSVALSFITAIAAVIAKAVGLIHSKHDIQVLVRLTLATLNALGLLQLRRALASRFEYDVSTMFTLLTCSQFHIPFWMGRTLPNMFALYPVNVAFAFLVAKCASSQERQKNYNIAIAILTFATVTLRSELILLLGPVVFQALYLRYTNLSSVIKSGLVSGILSLALTVLIDSYFWDTWPLWPELTGLYFNVYEGKSSQWGTTPLYTYFAVHLPKLLFSALPLSVLGLFADRWVRSVLFPCVAFVALLSCLGHKEWRFIVYVVPVWNIAGARGATWLLSARITHRHAVISHSLKLFLAGLFGLNIVATMLLTQASMCNYPGGEALRRLNDILEHPAFRRDGLSVHIDNFAAQTGASLFLHEHALPRGFLASPREPVVIYNKTENLAWPDDFQRFDWIITEHAPIFLPYGHRDSGWSVEGSVDGLRGVELKPLGERGVWTKIKIPRVVQEPKLWLLRRERD